MAEDGSPDTTVFRSRLSEVRHDLRTPVGHIIGYSEMLEEDLDDASDPYLIRDLKRIRASGERLAELIDDLLGAAKQRPEDIDIRAAHEQLRTQLDQVSGYSEMVREQAEEDDREELLPDIEKISAAADAFTKVMEERLEPSALLALGEVEESAADGTEGTETDEAAALSADAYEAASLSEGGRILVADDDAANRELLQRRLERQGYEVVAVQDGEAALEHLHSSQVDLLLLDMIMPGLSGVEVLRRLKSDEVLRNVPVIMLSALDDVNEVVRCVVLGAEDYVLKPFNPVLLKARIAATLEKHRLRVQQALQLRVFISSPGDVIPERRVVRRVIDRLNDELRGQVYLAPMFWEDEPLLASETFQAQIHSPQGTDIYVGIFWARLGSPLPEHIRRADGTRYASGSEFEFEEAMSGYRANARPEIVVYRKTTEPLVPLTNRSEVEDRLDQKELLEDFLDRWFKTADGKSYSGAFHTFEEAEQLEEMVAVHLRKLVINRLEAES
jgi:CheY-like chemotaxis protein